MITRTVEGVRMCYSLAIMFHEFPVVRMGENTTVNRNLCSLINSAYIIGTGGKEWDSQSEMDKRRIQRYAHSLHYKECGKLLFTHLQLLFNISLCLFAMVRRRGSD